MCSIHCHFNMYLNMPLHVTAQVCCWVPC
uniref:Uncharacterized protein n=1 Tax=Anguilla anguilla TaxID=7936 RepID=A0A0E9RZI8_ANGAN